MRLKFHGYCSLPDDVEDEVSSGAFVGASYTLAVAIFEVPLKLILSSTYVIAAYASELHTFIFQMLYPIPAAKTSLKELRNVIAYVTVRSPACNLFHFAVTHLDCSSFFN